VRLLRRRLRKGRARPEGVAFCAPASLELAQQRTQQMSGGTWEIIYGYPRAITVVPMSFEGAVAQYPPRCPLATGQRFHIPLLRAASVPRDGTPLPARLLAGLDFRGTDVPVRFRWRECHLWLCIFQGGHLGPFRRWGPRSLYSIDSPKDVIAGAGIHFPAMRGSRHLIRVTAGSRGFRG